MLRRGNSILNRLFTHSVHSIRQLTHSDSEAKAMYHFLQNDNVSEDAIIRNMSSNCVSCVGDKSVLCIQDTTEINLYNHKNRIKKDGCFLEMCPDGSYSMWVSTHILTTHR